jgi:hypothetical protein
MMLTTRPAINRKLLMQTANDKSTTVTQSELTEHIFSYYDHYDALQSRLGPVLRSLVPATLLREKFPGVQLEWDENKLFNVVRFLREAMELFSSSTTIKGAIALGKAIDIASNTTGRLTSTMTKISAAVLVAKRIDLAGPGDESLTTTFYTRLEISLHVLALSNVAKYAPLRASVSFLNALDELRNSNFSPESWLAVLNRIEIFENARNIADGYAGDDTFTGFDELLRHTNTYNAETSENDQSNISGEVRMPQIRDIRKEMSAWSIEWKNGTCFTCGDLPCKYRQTDGHCAGRGTVNGRANYKAGFLQKKIWNTSNAKVQDIQEKSTTAAMYNDNTYADSDSSSDNDSDTITIHEDSILVDEDCENELERMHTTAYMMRAELQMTDEIEINARTEEQVLIEIEINARTEEQVLIETNN